MSELASHAPAPVASRRNQIIVLAALALILNALFNHLGSNEADLNKILKVGDPFPAYSLTSMDGKPISNTDFVGKPVLYFFFANWCPCSHESAPFIMRAQKEFGSELSIVGVGIQDSTSNLERFVNRYKPDFPVIVDGGSSIARASGVAITPTTLFIGADGKLGAIHIGKVEQYEQLQNGIEAILGTKKVAGSVS